MLTLIMIKADILVRASGNMNDQKEVLAGAEATFIPLIMKLIRLRLTHDEKLNVSQNVYNAFLKHQNNRKEKEDEKKKKMSTTKNSHKNYLLRF
jgi:hypothetical protein